MHYLKYATFLVLRMYMPKTHSMTPEKERLEKANFGFHDLIAEALLLIYLKFSLLKLDVYINWTKKQQLKKSLNK